jgi:hypothetical protein
MVIKMILYIIKTTDFNGDEYMIRKTEPQRPLPYWRNPVYAVVDTDKLIFKQIGRKKIKTFSHFSRK